MSDLIARAVIDIAAGRERVWGVLLAPSTPTKIFPVTEVLAPFRLGEPFAWMFDLLGTSTRVDGRVDVVEPPSLLVYSFVDPHTRAVHRRQVSHSVRVVLDDVSDDGGPRTRVTVTQDGNETRAAHLHAEGGWRFALAHLRAAVLGAG